MRDADALSVAEALHEGRESVEVLGKKWMISTRGGTRMVTVEGTTFATQNKEKQTNWGAAARAGRRVTWAMTDPEWGLILDGVIHKRCPAFPGDLDGVAVIGPIVAGPAPAQVHAMEQEPPAKIAKKLPVPTPTKVIVVDPAAHQQPKPKPIVVAAAAPVVQVAMPPKQITEHSTVADVCTWLASVGFAALVPAFTRNDINGSLLLTLTEPELAEIGVASFGQRRALLSAISHLSNSAAKLAEAAAVAVPTGNRFSGDEAVVYRGILAIPPGFVPKGSCRESIEAAREQLEHKIPMLDMVVCEADKATDSVSTSPAAKDLIEKHGLTRDEVYALVVYTYDIGTVGETWENFYFQLNEILRRRNTAEMKQLLPYLYFAFGALRKLPSFQGVVYRGNNSPDIVKREYTTGRKIFWSGFTSTTVDFNVAKEFAGKKGVVFRIKIANGKIISAFSVIGSESEVLLPPNACLIVASEIHTEANGIQFVDLIEEVGSFRW